MTHYSIEPRDRIWMKYVILSYLKGYGFLPYVKIMSGNIRKNLRGKYNRKLADHAKKSATDALKTTLKRVIKKTSEATGDVTGNKITNKITKYSP